MPFTVVIPQDITAAGKEYLREKGYEVIVGSGSLNIADLRREAAPADALLVRTAPYPAEVIDAAPKLKVISRHGVGVDNIDVGHCTSKGIWVTFSPNSNTISVAEHAIGMLVAAAHRFAFMDRRTRQGDWEVRNRRTGFDLNGKTLGVVGLGRIGRMVAEKCRAAFDMKVLGFDAYLPAERFPEGAVPSGLERLFAEADFITLHVPTTPETKGMVNLRLLSLMKKNAFLVNCARGGVVVEKDLYDVLASDGIGGAALDVFEIEPAAADNPLFRLDNVLVTPHSAALTAESMDRMGLHAAMGIHAVLSGARPEWAVNNPAGK